MLINYIYVCLENIYVCISPANKSLFVSALCSALCQVPDRHRAHPAGLLLQGEVGVRDLQRGESGNVTEIKRSLHSVETENWAFFDTFWPRVAIFVFDP